MKGKIMVMDVKESHYGCRGLHEITEGLNYLCKKSIKKKISLVIGCSIFDVKREIERRERVLCLLGGAWEFAKSEGINDPPLGDILEKNWNFLKEIPIRVILMDTFYKFPSEKLSSWRLLNGESVFWKVVSTGPLSYSFNDPREIDLLFYAIEEKIKTPV